MQRPTKLVAAKNHIFSCKELTWRYKNSASGMLSACRDSSRTIQSLLILKDPRIDLGWTSPCTWLRLLPVLGIARTVGEAK